jgi:hypothetical protein
MVCHQYLVLLLYCAGMRLACWSVRGAAAAAAATAPERPPHRMLVAQEGEAAMARWPIVHGRS